MMSVEKFRSLTPDHQRYSDEEIQEIINELYELAGLAFDCWVSRQVTRKE